jgi:hypothetical protein
VNHYPRNSKVVGSNPTPTTSSAGRLPRAYAQAADQLFGVRAELEVASFSGPYQLCCGVRMQEGADAWRLGCGTRVDNVEELVCTRQHRGMPCAVDLLISAGAFSWVSPKIAE